MAGERRKRRWADCIYSQQRSVDAASRHSSCINADHTNTVHQKLRTRAANESEWVVPERCSCEA